MGVFRRQKGYTVTMGERKSRGNFRMLRHWLDASANSREGRRVYESIQVKIKGDSVIKIWQSLSERWY